MMRFCGPVTVGDVIIYMQNQGVEVVNATFFSTNPVWVSVNVHHNLSADWELYSSNDFRSDKMEQSDG